MELYGITKSEIKDLAVLEGDYYKLTTGRAIEVTVIRKNNSNIVLTQNLSSDVQQDKFMVRYRPNNMVYFDRDFIDDDKACYISCQIDKENNCVKIGKPDKYPISSGVIATTGVLSLNGLVEENRVILYSNRLSDEAVKKKVTLLSVGLKGDELFGLVHIPRHKGIAISVDGTQTMGKSVASEKERNCWEWKSMTIDDLFTSYKINIPEDVAYG